MSVCYSISIADAVKNGYSLSGTTKQKYRFIDIAKFLDDQIFEVLQFSAEEDSGHLLPGRIPANAQPYATLSYPWRDLSSLATAGSADQTFINADIPKETPTSVKVLRAVCVAARGNGCNYLWMDKLSVRQDSQSEGKEDRAWQLKRMYSVYRDCKVCLVAAGGMVRLPRLAEKTSWIDRAWTLQEALAPPEVMCLFVWHSGDEPVSGGNISFTVQQVLPGVGLTSLGNLLAANLHADEPTMTKGRNYKGDEIDVAVLPDDPDSRVWCFGNRKADDWPIVALQAALERPNPCATGSVAESELSARRLGIWRCITMRNASYAEDFVFATMGIFDVIVEPLIDPKTKELREPSYPEDEIQELLDNYLRALSSKGSRADWFAVAPELGPARETTALPLVPDINYTKDKDGKPASTTVKKLLNYWDRFNWYLADALKYTVDAPNGIKVTAPVHAIAPAGTLQSGDTPGLSLQRIHDGSSFQITAESDEARYAIVIGRKARYRNGNVPSIAGDTDEVLLMLVEYILCTTHRYRNIGYAWVQEKFVDGWREKTLGIGIRGG